MGGKRESARYEQFLLFPTVFSTLFENFPSFLSNLKLSSANSFSLEESKICRLLNRFEYAFPTRSISSLRKDKFLRFVHIEVFCMMEKHLLQKGEYDV